MLLPAGFAEEAEKQETYIVCYRRLRVTASQDRTSKLVAWLSECTRVEVLGGRLTEDDGRVRAPVVKPAGWISIKLADDSAVFAIKASPPNVGDHVTFSLSDSEADWNEFPYGASSKLSFSVGTTTHVAMLSSDKKWFHGNKFERLWAPVSALREYQAPNADAMPAKKPIVTSAPNEGGTGAAEAKETTGIEAEVLKEKLKPVDDTQAAELVEGNLPRTAAVSTKAPEVIAEPNATHAPKEDRTAAGLEPPEETKLAAEPQAANATNELAKVVSEEQTAKVSKAKISTMKAVPIEEPRQDAERQAADVPEQDAKQHEQSHSFIHDSIEDKVRAQIRRCEDVLRRVGNTAPFKAQWTQASAAPAGLAQQRAVPSQQAKRSKLVARTVTSSWHSERS